jgi:hypothetical protein
MKYFLIAVAVLVLACVGLVGFDLSDRPGSWESVHLGDAAVDVKGKFPAIDDHLHSTQSVDILVQRGLTGHWVSFFGYGSDDRVNAKMIQFRLGTLRHFLVLKTIKDPEPAGS